MDGQRLFHPLRDDVPRCVDEYETLLCIVGTQIVLFLLHWLLLHLLLPTLLSINLEVVLVVGNLIDDLAVGLLQSDLHNVSHLATTELSGVAKVTQKLVCRVGALVDANDFVDWDEHSGPVGEALECQVIFVDKNGMLIEHKVALHDAAVLLSKLADRAFHDHTVAGPWVEILTPFALLLL